MPSAEEQDEEHNQREQQTAKNLLPRDLHC
jgi:hypothetical protein